MALSLSKPVRNEKIQAESRDEKGRFVPGVSGNPNGRPHKGYSISDMVKGMLAKDPKRKRKLGEKILEVALSGDVTAIKMLWNYMDGMPKQVQELIAENPIFKLEIDGNKHTDRTGEVPAKTAGSD